MRYLQIDDQHRHFVDDLLRGIDASVSFVSGVHVYDSAVENGVTDETVLRTCRYVDARLEDARSKQAILRSSAQEVAGLETLALYCRVGALWGEWEGLAKDISRGVASVSMLLYLPGGVDDRAAEWACGYANDVLAGQSDDLRLFWDGAISHGLDLVASCASTISHDLPPGVVIGFGYPVFHVVSLNVDALPTCKPLIGTRYWYGEVEKLRDMLTFDTRYVLKNTLHGVQVFNNGFYDNLIPCSLRVVEKNINSYKEMCGRTVRRVEELLEIPEQLCSGRYFKNLSIDQEYSVEEIYDEIMRNYEIICEWSKDSIAMCDRALEEVNAVRAEFKELVDEMTTLAGK